jgi:hypothetical protein
MKKSIKTIASLVYTFAMIVASSLNFNQPRVISVSNQSEHRDPCRFCVVYPVNKSTSSRILYSITF